LTDTEERAAFLNAVLSQGQTIIDKVGASSETSAEKVQSLGAAFTDAGDKIKNNLAPPLAAVAQSLAWILKMAGSSPWYGAGGSLLPPAGPRDEWATPSRVPTGLGARHLPALIRGIGIPGASGIKDQWRGKLDIDQTGAPGGMKGMTDAERMAVIMQDNPGLKMGEVFQEQFNLVGAGLSTLGDSFAGFFEMLVTDSENAGRAFFSGLMSGFAGIAATLGDFFIQMGTATHAIKTLNPFAAIAAGIALKALSGIMRGIAFNNAPSTTSAGIRSTRQPLATGDGAGGQTTFIIQGDFVGDRAWIDQLAKQLRLAQRNRGIKVVWEGA
jgi:hypothetical protein